MRFFHLPPGVLSHWRVTRALYRKILVLAMQADVWCRIEDPAFEPEAEDVLSYPATVAWLGGGEKAESLVFDPRYFSDVPENVREWWRGLALPA